jgi:hypothetical protein
MVLPVIDRKRDVRRSEPPYAEREFGASQSDYEPKEQKMSDIVERLNRFKTLLIKSDASKPEGVAVAMLAEAAAEIDRLRAGQLRDGCGCGCHWAFKDESDLEGTLDKECAYHMDIRLEGERLRAPAMPMVAVPKADA